MVPAILAFLTILGDCNGEYPDFTQQEFCDGGIQSACENVATQALCTGIKRKRYLVTYACAEGGFCYENCVNGTWPCWQDTVCVWTGSNFVSGLAIDSGTTQGKVNGPCERAPDCYD